jgi:hypothetical protein
LKDVTEGMRDHLSELDREAKRIRQWAEFLVVLFGTSAILALLYDNVPVLTASATIFAWGMWTLNKDAVALDQARVAERRYRDWREHQRRERERLQAEAEAVARRQRGTGAAGKRDGQGPERRCPAGHSN